MERGGEGALASHWEEYYDEESGTPYFYNAESGETTWERPSPEW